MNNIAVKIIWISVVYLFFALPFAYLPITQDPETTLRYSLASLLVTMLTAYFLFSRNTSVVSIKVTPLLLAFAGYVLVTGLSLTKTLNSGDGVFEFLKLVSCFGLFIIITEALRKSPQEIERITTGIALGAFVFTVWGLIQVLNLLPDLLNDGFSFAHINRVTSSLSNKNFFSETLMMTLPFSIFCMVIGVKIIKILAAVTTVVSILLIAMLQSINVYIALVFFIILLTFCYVKWMRKSGLIFFKNPPNRLIKTSVLISIILLIIITAGIIINKSDPVYFSTKYSTFKSYASSPSSIFELNDADNNSSVYDRLFLARNSVEMIKDSPVTGIGVSNWRILLPKYGMYGNTIMSTGRIRFEHPHNEYLFILSETGVAGLTLWLSVLVIAIYSSLKVIKRIIAPKEKFFLSLMVGGITIFLLMSAFSYPKERFFTMILLVVILAIVNSSVKEFWWAIPLNRVVVVMLLAVSLTITAIFINRYGSEVRFFSALKAQKTGNFRKMKTLLEKAQTPFHILDFTSTPINWHLGQSNYYQGNHEAAFNHYLLASEENPYHMQVLNDLGALYESKGDHQKAIECFHRVFAINPDFSDSKWNMIAVYFNMGETEKAFDLIKDMKPRFTDKWRSDMIKILHAKAEKLVQVNRDTQLADYLNERLAKQPHFLLDEFILSEKDSLSFEEQLSKNKQ